MSKRHSGFTLIELLVVIVIIGVLVAIALPNFLKIREKAKEAEAKSNLHSIQLSLERYATDNEGFYPFYLYGGDAFYNSGTAHAFYGKWYAMIPSGNGKNPFDTFEYDNRGGFYGDALIFEGYMTKYPRNPFVNDGKAIFYGKEGAENINLAHSMFGQGGEDGRQMFCLSPAGEVPIINDVVGGVGEEVKLAFPGSFTYHPRFGDGATNAEHIVQQYEDLGSPNGYISDIAALYGGLVDTTFDIYTLDVYGYDLVGVGSTSNNGLDIDWDTARQPFTYDTNPGYTHHHRTGYIVNGQERNPYYTRQSDLAPYEEFTTGDGFGDFYIIFLNGGLDVKPGR